MSPALNHSYYRQNREYNTKEYKKQILTGNFPIHEDIRGLKIRNINKFLCVLTVMAIIASMISYSIVCSAENKISKLHTQISELNYENIELENKLENIKSFYSVDKKISETKTLNKAKNVLEVNEVDKELELSPYRRKLKINSTLGY